ncbi:MAG: hypothetical protein N0E48_20170, partial [Candidatus Thiodiazotropha endolucinida]|nr:hypothetical protein [Candidatus Thiodiazotropha taylori]MCW4345652.1 hypothetical protein [Candidatus Thiodiazotropha endolucinida]
TVPYAVVHLKMIRSHVRNLNFCFRNICMSHLNSDICQACAATNSTLSQYSHDQTPDKQLQTIDSSSYNATRSNSSGAVSDASALDLAEEDTRLINELKQRESDISQKQKEMRQLEAKLRKKDEELKLKELKIKEYESKSGKLESKIESLEFRNRELEQTITYMTDHIKTLESEHVPNSPVIQPTASAPKSAAPGSSQPSNNYRSEKLIQGIHDRVSAYLLLQVEKQIDKLIDLGGDTDCLSQRNQQESSTCNDNIVYPLSNNITKNQPCNNMDLSSLNGDTAVQNAQFNQVQDFSRRCAESTYVPQAQLPSCIQRESTPFVQPVNMVPCESITRTYTTADQYYTGHPLKYDYPEYTCIQESQQQNYNTATTLPSQEEKKHKRFLRYSNLINLTK